MHCTLKRRIEEVQGRFFIVIVFETLLLAQEDRDKVDTNEHVRHCGISTYLGRERDLQS